MTTSSPIRAEIAQIVERFAEADRRAKRAVAIPDRHAAEDERREAAGEYWGAGNDLAQLFLLLIRYALQHEPDALRLYLVEAIRPELKALAEAITRLEARR
jgi:hypothetical protein